MKKVLKITYSASLPVKGARVFLSKQSDTWMTKAKIHRIITQGSLAFPSGTTNVEIIF